MLETEPLSVNQRKCLKNSLEAKHGSLKNAVFKIIASRENNPEGLSRDYVVIRRELNRVLQCKGKSQRIGLLTPSLKQEIKFLLGETEFNKIISVQPTFVQSERKTKFDGFLSGKWESIINKQDGPNQKTIDLVECSHDESGDIHGKIRGSIPKSRRVKRWFFQGKHINNFVFMIFWAEKNELFPESAGTIQLRIEDRDYLAGFYVEQKLQKAIPKLKRINMEWRRVV